MASEPPNTTILDSNDDDDPSPIPEQEGTLIQDFVPSPGDGKKITMAAVRLMNAPQQAAFPRIDGYQFEAELGQGGMGIVYKAMQVLANRTVAVKTISVQPDAELRSRFFLEVQAIAELEHPHIVKVFDVGEAHGRPYFAMEFCSGGSLQASLDGTPWASIEAATLVEKLARGVALAHEHGIVHRDLKPANVLVGADGEPKITDFGLAKRLDTDHGQTRTGVVMGTPCYMAPEQAAGKLDRIGPATDVYALGAILFELLTGRPPFKGSTPVETMEQVRKIEPLSVRSLNPNAAKDLDTICAKCLAKDPAGRYRHAGALADDLNRWLSHMPILARPVGLLEQSWHWVRRNPPLAGTIFASLFGLIFAFIHLRQLTDDLVRSSAVDSALQQAILIEEANEEYADVVNRAKEGPFPVTLNRPPEPNKMPLSVPATFIHDLSARYAKRENESGVRFRMYSDFPFPWRKDESRLDDFERMALDRIRDHPDEIVHEFAEIDGRETLRLVKGRMMSAACVECHNHHPQTPKNDWKVGDVRGVLEIVRPLDADTRRIAGGFRATFAITVAVFLSIFGVCLMTLFFRRARHRSSVVS